MRDIDICANCGDMIGKLEEAHIWKDSVVCRACRERLASRDDSPADGSVKALIEDRAEIIAELESRRSPEKEDRERFKATVGFGLTGVQIDDRARPLPPKPKLPFLMLEGRFEYLPMQRVKLVLHDPDIDTISTMTAELPHRLPTSEIASAVARESGKVVRKIVVIERFWLKSYNPGSAEKALTTVAIWSLFT